MARRMIQGLLSPYVLERKLNLDKVNRIIMISEPKRTKLVINETRPGKKERTLWEG